MNLLPFNQGKWKTQIGVGILLVALVFGFATQCAKAEDSYVQMGAGSTVVRGPAPVIDIQLVYPDLGPKDARVEFGATFIGGSTFKDSFQTNNFAWSAAVVESLGRFDIGLGAAYLQNTDTYNGSHANFKLLFGYRYERLSIRWSHFSNGGTQAPNKGRDMVTLNWVF